MLTYRMNYLDLFSGIGGFALAAQWAGFEFEHHFISEIDEYANRVYARHFPRAVQLGDVKRIKAKELRGQYDGPWLVTGGYPCQDLSTAGKQAGIMRGKRSNLWFEMHRIIDELRPEAILVENVPALSYQGLDRCLFCLAASGYDAEWQTISAASTGAPHIRERLWIVAYPNGLRTRRRLAACNEETRDVGTQRVADSYSDRAIPWLAWEAETRDWCISGQPLIHRKTDGIPTRLDIDWMSRGKALGNAIVPQVATPILARLKTLLFEEQQNA